MTANKQDHPDANLHPLATGLAIKTVKAHEKEKSLKLYSGWFCPFVQRVWLVLEEKKIPYQYIEVNPYHKPKELLALNPRGLVPTLEYDNKPLYESTIICEFLEEAYPENTPHLLPSDPYERARTRIWSDYCTSRIIPAYFRFLQHQPLSDKTGLDEKRKEFLGHLMEFTSEMHEAGPYFLGPEPSLIDFIVAPFAVRLWVFDEFKEGLGVPAEGQGRTFENVWARWRKWINAIEGRESVKVTTSDKEHYLPIYGRYADDKAQSELAKATRKGRGVP